MQGETWVWLGKSCLGVGLRVVCFFLGGSAARPRENGLGILVRRVDGNAKITHENRPKSAASKYFNHTDFRSAFGLTLRGGGRGGPGAAAGVPQFVALCGLTVVGWCDIVRLYPHPGYEHNGRLGIGVVAAWRGRGLGRGLLEQALSAASGAGFRRVELDVYASNTAALSLYKSCGFTVEGVKRAMRLLDGRVDDVVLMACSMTDGSPEALLHG